MNKHKTKQILINNNKKKNKNVWIDFTGMT